MTQDLPGSGHTALVTGASSGIGAALAQRFARAGFNLVLVARSEDKLKQQARALAAEHAIRAWVAPADLSQPDAVRQLAAQMKRARRPIDVLVNCAGVLAHGSFIDMEATRHRELIDLLLPMLPTQLLWINLVATVTLALPLALEAKEPDVMNRPPRDPREPVLNKFVVFRTFLPARQSQDTSVSRLS